MSQKSRRTHPVRITAVEIVIICIISLCVLLLVTNSVEAFISMLYSPVAFLVLVVALVEYIILKSADRSRIYRIELDHLRRRVMDHIMLFNTLERNLDEIQKILATMKKNPGLVDTPEEKSLDELEKQLATICSRMRSML